jgi:hypothetical protein
MECHSLPKINSAEPSLSVTEFEVRCKRLAADFSKALKFQTGDIFFSPEVTSAVALMSLGGRASEVIARNQGQSHRVVPLCKLAEEVHIWIGFRERWTRNAGDKKYSFEDGGFTLHLGREGEISKPQILRSEWVGCRSSSFANRAGHPHWQLDVLETARSHTSPARSHFSASEKTADLAEFEPAPPTVTPKDILLGLTIERMHLASAAQWWRHPALPIANAPSNVQDLDRWILGCLNYMRQEIQRCIIVETVHY